MRRVIKKIANPNALPPLLDKKAEKERIDSCMELAYSELHEHNRRVKMRRNEKIITGGESVWQV